MMEAHWIPVALFVVCLPISCLCKPLESGTMTGAKRSFDTHGLDIPDGIGNFQEWSNWKDKKAFGKSGLPFGRNPNFQSWRDKRALLSGNSGPTFGDQFGHTSGFQKWMDKRGFGTNGYHEAFKGMVPMNNEQFQRWSDWMSKRGGNRQLWEDFSKKANFGSTPDFSEIEGMQPWHVYKRFGGMGQNDPFSQSFDTNYNMMKWDDLMKRGKLGSKQQTSFGEFHGYFNNGLQDWRNPAKRSSSDAKNSNSKSN